jgi:peptide/nickel transport system permease protein
MISFIARRAIATAVLLFAITVVTFLIFFETPGIDPARQLAGKHPTPEIIAEIRHKFALDRPLPVRYWRMMKQLFVTRDLVSYTNGGVKVIPEIASAAPVDFSLVLGAAVIWVVLSIAIGIAAAVLRGTVFDPLLMMLALIGISVPVFWLGEVANLITQDRLHHTFLFSWVPPLGYTALSHDPAGWATHLIIPWFVLAVLYVGYYSRVLRASILEKQNEDFVRTAVAKGASSAQVLRRHILRNSMISYVSLFGLDFGALVGGGALLTEVVFGLPGVGRLTYDSLQTLDLPVIMATVVYGAFFIVLVNALVDVFYAWLDPRVRVS